jgi:hypothetical protein
MLAIPSYNPEDFCVLSSPVLLVPQPWGELEKVHYFKTIFVAFKGTLSGLLLTLCK